MQTLNFSFFATFCKLCSNRNNNNNNGNNIPSSSSSCSSVLSTKRGNYNNTQSESAMKWKFKEDHLFGDRHEESTNIRSKYPDRIPVIVQKAPRSNVPSIDKQKFLVPSDISVAQLMWIIRKRIQLAPEKAIFLFVGRVLPQSSASMSAIYEDYADEDGFLYIMYSGESTFGL